MLTFKQQFIRFLKQNNVYEQYIYNFNNGKYYRERFFNGKTPFLSEDSPYGYITNAFSWGFTKEGTNFWLMITTKWDRIVWQRIHNCL